MQSRKQEEEQEKRRLREFLLEQGVSGTVVDEELSVLWINKVRNVVALCAFSSEEKLQSLKAKNEQGEELRLGAGTTAILWRYIESKQGGGKAVNSGTSSPILMSRFTQAERTDTNSTRFQATPPGSRYREEVREWFREPFIPSSASRY